MFAVCWQPTKVLLATNIQIHLCPTKRKRIFIQTTFWCTNVFHVAKRIWWRNLPTGDIPGFDIEKYVEKWRSVNKDNYKEMQDFFYCSLKLENLDYIDSKDMDEIKRSWTQNRSASLFIFSFQKEYWAIFKHLLNEDFVIDINIQLARGFGVSAFERK